MRPVLFRGRDWESRVWLYGSLVTRSDKGRMYIVTKESIFVPYEVDPSTVGEFTGLKDEAGNDIYEDDILSFCRVGHEEEVLSGIVSYADGAFRVNGLDVHELLCMMEYHYEDIKVSGTIC